MINQLTETARSLFDFYLNSSIHVALAVTAFAGITFFNLRLESSYQLLLFIFFSTIIGYNLTKYASANKKASEKKGKTDTSIFVFSLICLAPLFWVTLSQPLSVIIVSVLLGLITLSYSWPVLWRRSNLRDITGLKIFVIAFVWSTATVLLPVLTNDYVINKNFFLEYKQRFLFVIILTLPFDIRDIRFDTWQLGTIPQIIGIKRSRILGVILLGLVVLFECLKTPFLLDQALILLCISVLTGFLVMKSVVKQTQYYASFWVESIPVVWYGLLFFLG